jgi:hypothetical protein
VIRDAEGRLYVLRFDAAQHPEMATAAEMISSRFFHALGYHVPETYLVTFDRDQLAIADNAGDITSNAEVRRLLPAQIDRVLSQVHRGRDGRYRGLALLVPVDFAGLVGPYQLYGTRSDDPNDIVAHEHRRDLRGLSVFAAWLNHTRFNPLHTFDVVVQPEGQAPHIRHYLFDLMATLGSGISGPKAVWEGRDPLYGQSATLRNIATLGLYSPAWMRASYPDLTGVGHLEAATFEPDAWKPVFDVAPFANRLPDDEFWAARQVMAFSDEDIRAIVEVGGFSDPKAAQWIADCLIERRNRIGRAAFAKVLPLDAVAASGGSLTFADLAVDRGFVPARRYRVGWSQFDNATGKPSASLGTVRSDLQIPAEAAAVPAGGHVLAQISAEGLPAGMIVTAHLRREGEGLRVIGLDHEWPGRTLINPRADDRPIANRFSELEPERQQLFSTYARALNEKTGQVLSPDERFRELSPSEQTTFDGVTHALMRSSLTDDQGASLGSALDLLSGLDRIAGEQAGRGGDQQYRLYVRLRPDAEDILDRSREFVRSHDNTVYHPGYPHSYRLGSGVPSVQFSLSADRLSADIDVDYRSSKAPQSLFNGHLTSSNSDVRSGDNAKRHSRRWTGFVNWWAELFGGVRFGRQGDAGPFDASPTRTPTPLPADRPSGATIPDLPDAVQEFLSDWLIRRNYAEASAFFAPDVLPCVADSMELGAKPSPERLRQASLQLLQRSAETWGRVHSLTEAMNAVLPWSPSVKVMPHAFERDFAVVEAPTELGQLYACGAPPPAKKYQPSTTPEYGTYYGAVLQVVHEGQPGGTLVLVWRQVDGAWRLVSYRAVE